jgi:hypothetical protein
MHGREDILSVCAVAICCFVLAEGEQIGVLLDVFVSRTVQDRALTELPQRDREASIDDLLSFNFPKPQATNDVTSLADPKAPPDNQPQMPSNKPCAVKFALTVISLACTKTARPSCSGKLHQAALGTHPPLRGSHPHADVFLRVTWSEAGDSLAARPTDPGHALWAKTEMEGANNRGGQKLQSDESPPSLAIKDQRLPVPFLSPFSSHLFIRLPLQPSSPTISTSHSSRSIGRLFSSRPPLWFTAQTRCSHSHCLNSFQRSTRERLVIINSSFSHHGKMLDRRDPSIKATSLHNPDRTPSQ